MDPPNLLLMGMPSGPPPTKLIRKNMNRPPRGRMTQRQRPDFRHSRPILTPGPSTNSHYSWGPSSASIPHQPYNSYPSYPQYSRLGPPPPPSMPPPPPAKAPLPTPFESDDEDDGRNRRKPKPNPFQFNVRRAPVIHDYQHQVLHFGAIPDLKLKPFVVTITKIGGCNDPEQLGIGHNPDKPLSVSGRLNLELVRTYMKQVRESPKRTAQLFKISPLQNPDSFDEFCAHFTSVERAAVVDLEAKHNTLLYIIPGELNMQDSTFIKCFGCKKPNQKACLVAFHTVEEKRKQNESDILAALQALTGTKRRKKSAR